ncbi:MAG: ribbon-helix-helix domain-containing protein [Sphingorhabdus sp.]
MAKLERITVTMPEEMAAKMRAAVEAGEYATTSEIVREALRDWNDLQERRELALERLRSLIQEGVDSEALDGKTVLAELRAKYRID